MRADGSRMTVKATKDGSLFFGRIDPPLMSLIVKTARRAAKNATWPDALGVFCYPYLMTAGERLDTDEERGEEIYNCVENYFSERYADLPVKEQIEKQELVPQVKTLQVTQKHLAQRFFNGQTKMAGRFMSRMVEAGLIEEIESKHKGFATLYVVHPLPGEEWRYGWEVEGRESPSEE